MSDDHDSIDGFFDHAHYLTNNPDVAENIASTGGDPLAHFMAFGWREGRWPNPYFDPTWYLEANLDVRDAGKNPLLHYIFYGEAEGRRPVPAFDPVWYREQHGLEPDASPLRHFLLHRTDGMASPVPGFDAAWYVRRYPDVAETGRDLYAHYREYGIAEGRAPRPDCEIIAASGLFDVSHYLISGPDVRGCGLDPLAHFCSSGHLDGRRSNAYFDPRWYAATYLPKQADPPNALTNYVLQGETLGRRPVVYFDPGWYRRAYGIAEGQSPLLHYLTHRRTQRFSPTPAFDVAFFMRRYGSQIGPNRDPFAYYLLYGARHDLQPSPDFDAASYRRRKMRRVRRNFSREMALEDRNPLTHFLLTEAQAGDVLQREIRPEKAVRPSV